MSREQHRSLDLFPDRNTPLREYAGLAWPSATRFPLNLLGKSVSAIVHDDLRSAKHPLIITGYAALDRVIELASDCETAESIRILFGSEPYPTRRETYELSDHTFPKEIQSYWLKRGISLLLSAKLIHCIELIRSGRIKARYLGTSRCRLHAKIYCTEDAATVGSSNFTRPGMESQLEANARFTVK